MVPMTTPQDPAMIRLDDLLKLVGLADSGGQAKMMVQQGNVTVNGDVDTRRGRKLHAGDKVAVNGQTVVVDAELLRREPKISIK
jgi:ribosome-associated protein